MGNPNELELPLMAPPSYSEEEIESTSLTAPQKNFKMNVVYMVVEPSDEVVVTQSEFYFDADMTVEEASDIAIRGYPDASGTLFEQKAVLFKPKWYRAPTMVGNRDRKMSDVYKPKGTMWVTNTSNSFRKLMTANAKKHRIFLSFYMLFLLFCMVWPTVSRILVLRASAN